jgi:hypothetical protein
MGWPPQAGELLPRADEAITVETIAHLEAEIRRGIRMTLIRDVIEGSDQELKCVVEFPIKGVGQYQKGESS